MYFEEVNYTAIAFITTPCQLDILWIFKSFDYIFIMELGRWRSGEAYLLLSQRTWGQLPGTHMKSHKHPEPQFQGIL